MFCNFLEENRMKTALVVCAVISLSAAFPNNFYHQEYKYKTSSSSYRNNELQHKKDNEGYLTKDGDLEGRVQPIVNSHNQHSEYVNPKLKSLNDYGGSYYSMGGLGSGRVNSYGQMEADANLGTGYGGLYNGLTTNQFGSSSKNLISDGLASSDHISGMHSGYAYQGSYGMTGGQSYGMNSNLQAVINQLENELASQLNGAVYRYGNNGYSTSTMQLLEEELRRNLTSRLQDALMHQYGAQSIRGGYSYSINDGQVANNANYRHQELMDLQRQLENNLLSRLRNQYNQAYSSSSHHSSSSSSSYSNSQYTSVRPMYNDYYSSSTMRPYYTSTVVYPTMSYPTGYTSSYTQSHRSSMQESHSSSVRYTPIPNPESITVIASRVQNDLNTRLNALLENAENMYFTGRREYTMEYYNQCIERIRQELRTNMTYLFDNELRRNYGNQALRDGYMYSLGPDGQYSAEYNYMVNDLENLKRQIENNLITRLNSDFDTYRQRYVVSSFGSDYVSSANTGSYYPRYGSSTPSYYDVTTRPTSDHLLPLIASGGSGSYNYISGRSGSYSSSSTAGFSELQRQLQMDLSRQLQSAILRNQYRYTPQTYQTYYQELSDELQRNLTRQLQEAMTGHYGGSYGSYSMQQMNELRNLLQNDLMRELQQGLQTYSSSSSSSYHAASSSSSSNSNYRPVRLAAATSHGGVYYTGEDCDDTVGPVHHRLYKRAVYSPYSRNSHGGSYSRRNDNDFDQSQMSQQIEDEDLSQHQERPFENLELGQQQIDDDLSQKPENAFDNLYQKAQIGDEDTSHFIIQNTPKPIHQTYNTYDLHSSNRNGGNYHRSSSYNSYSDSGNYGRNNYNSNSNKNNADDDKSQTRNALNDHKLAVNSHLQFLQQEMEADQRHYYQPQRTSQVNRQSSNKLESGNQVKPIDTTQNQESDNKSSELSVQPLAAQSNSGDDGITTTEQTGFWRRVGNSIRDGANNIRDKISGPKNTENITAHQIKPIESSYKPSNNQEQIELGQQIDDSDLTQQIEEEFGKLEAGEQKLTQHHTIDNQHGHLQSPKLVGHINDDLTQQIEQKPFDNLEIGNQYKPTSPKPKRLHYSYQKPLEDQNQIELGQQQVELGQEQLGQQIDDSDLTQQVQEPFGKLDIENERSNQKLLTQQQEEPFGKLEIGSQRKPIELGQQQVDLDQQQELGQQIDDSDLTQQVQEPFGKLEIGSQRKPIELGQKPVDLDQQQELGQQIDDSDLGMHKYTILGLDQKPSSDLTQQIEQEPFDNWRTNNNQQIGQQQIEDLDVSKDVENKRSTTTVTQKTETTTPNYFNANSNRQSLAEAEAEADRLLAILRQNRHQSSSSYGYSSHSRHSSSYEGRGHYITRQNSYSPSTETYNRDEIDNGNSYGHGGYRSILTSQNHLGNNENTESQSSERNSYNRHRGSYGSYTQKPQDSENFQRTYSFRTNAGSTADQTKPKPLTAQLHYGTPKHVIEEVEIAQEIQPVEEQHATIINPSPASIETAPEPVNSYASNAGVKGGKKVEEVAPEVELTTENTEVVINTTEAGWWKRFGNKIKDGANKIKEKIVG